MKKIIINENQRGFLFKNGKYVKMLGAGKYYTFGDREIEVAELDQMLSPGLCTVDTLLRDNAVAQSVTTIHVNDREQALHFVNGNFESILRPGHYAFWALSDEHTFQTVDLSTPEVDPSVPNYIFAKIPQMYYVKVEVAEYQKARLYFDQKFMRILNVGTYWFWKTDTKVDVGYVDTRLTQMCVNGQEMMTLDKVPIRVNFVLTYRVTDYVKVLTEIDDFVEQLHVAAQLALRTYVGRYRLDELLENKTEMTAYVLEQLKAKEKELFVEITDAGVKDLILPGEIRQIMNTVLIAEKRAQANVITRREEVASTRSLLNTAKLMDENQTLYKLKEMEYIERICEKVGNITLNGNGDLLTQLSGMLKTS